MALAAGSVTVNGDNSHTGSGLALVLFEAEVNQITGMGFGSADTHALLTGLAGRCNRFAQALVPYLTAHAEITVTVDTFDVGLQTSTAVGNPTGPPAPNPVQLHSKGTLA